MKLKFFITIDNLINLALAYTDILLEKESNIVNICLLGSQRGNIPFIFLWKVNRLRMVNDVSTNGTISNAFDTSIAANGMVAWNQNVRHLKDKNWKIRKSKNRMNLWKIEIYLLIHADFAQPRILIVLISAFQLFILVCKDNSWRTIVQQKLI